MGGARSFVLAAEGHSDIEAPDPEDIAEMVDALCPSEGCGYMALEEHCPDERGDYIQAAGGRDARTGVSRFAVERRAYARDRDGKPDPHRPHQNLVAGLRGRSALGLTQIRTNGFSVTVRANEVLCARDVVEITTAFLRSRDLPAAYSWRSNREEVEDIIRRQTARRRRQ